MRAPAAAAASLALRARRGAPQLAGGALHVVAERVLVLVLLADVAVLQRALLASEGHTQEWG